MSSASTHRQENAAGNPGARFIDPRALARIDNLELMARTVVTGFLNGLHKSPYLGSSMDFAEHRPYLPGDDIRRIDWRLFARSDRFYVKLFEAETNTNFVAALDISRSMDYGSGEVTKADYARFLVATLTYFASRQRDRIGLITFGDDLADYIPPSAKHLDVILHTLARLGRGELEKKSRRPPIETREGSFGRTMTRIAGAMRRRGILVVVSDLYEPAENIVSALVRLRHSGQDVIVFHLLDPSEIEFSFEDPSSFEDLESEVRIPIIPEKLRSQYHELMGAHTETLSAELSANRIDHVLVDTSKPLDLALFEYLALRVKRSRTR